MSNPLEAARKAFRRHTWSEAYGLFSAAGKDSPLEPEDDELLAVAGYLLGKDQESADTWIRTHTKFLDRGNIERAIRSAFWAAFVFFHRQEGTRGNAWIARADRLLDKVDQDSVEQGYLLLPKALNDIDRGDATSAFSTLKKALAIADRFADRDLIALAQHASGRSLIRMGKIHEGARMLDEAMVAIEVGDVSPLVAGDVYCSVISGCMEVFDLRRAQEWTTALTHWCESQPDMVAYNGQCQVHRAEILRFQGAWSEALDATEKACLQCRQGPDRAAIGAAHYQRAEIYRLLGEFTRAEEDYRDASRHGRTPQPGLSLMRLAQDQIDAAKAAIGSALAQAEERRLQSRLLPACVEIMLAADELEEAHKAVTELLRISMEIRTPYLDALAAQAKGAVSLGDGNAQAALSELRRSWRIWRDLDASYEAARVRVLIGIACRDTGDEESAEMEFDAAYWIFQQLGAGPDMKKVELLSGRMSAGNTHGLTPREMEVLRLVAAGKTNKGIASELFISERTVDRHVSNIFLKLDVESRTAATSYAFKRNLI